jgi:hypothetical protein
MPPKTNNQLRMLMRRNNHSSKKNKQNQIPLKKRLRMKMISHST